MRWSFVPMFVCLLLCLLPFLAPSCLFVAVLGCRVLKVFSSSRKDERIMAEDCMHDHALSAVNICSKTVARSTQSNRAYF